MARKISFIIFTMFVFLSFNTFFVVAGDGSDTTPNPCTDSSLAGKLKCGITRMGLNLKGGVKAGETEDYLGKVIKSLLGFLAVIFFILIIYGGILWMTSAGNDTKVDKAKKIVVASTIGIAIIFTAYLITVLLVTILRPT